MYMMISGGRFVKGDEKPASWIPVISEVGAGSPKFINNCMSDANIVRMNGDLAESCGNL